MTVIMGMGFEFIGIFILATHSDRLLNYLLTKNWIAHDDDADVRTQKWIDKSRTSKIRGTGLFGIGFFFQIIGLVIN